MDLSLNERIKIAEAAATRAKNISFFEERGLDEIRVALNRIRNLVIGSNKNFDDYNTLKKTGQAVSVHSDKISSIAHEAADVVFGKALVDGMKVISGADLEKHRIGHGYFLFQNTLPSDNIIKLVRENKLVRELAVGAYTSALGYVSFESLKGLEGYEVNIFEPEIGLLELGTMPGPRFRDFSGNWHTVVDIPLKTRKVACYDSFFGDIITIHEWMNLRHDFYKKPTG